MTAGDQASEPIRQALNWLLDVRLEHGRDSEAVLADVRRDADRVARAIAGVRPGGDALADHVIAVMAAGTSAAECELTRAAEAFDVETLALRALLVGSPQVVGPEPPVVGPGPPVVEPRPPAIERQSSAEAEQAPTDAGLAPEVVEAFGKEFDVAVREEIVAMVTHPAGHTIQLHGPTVPDEALKARVSWKKDPMGRTSPKHAWARGADRVVETKHQIGHVVGRFISAEALAKPLRALLTHCGGTLAGLDAYLQRYGRAGRARIFVPADAAGLAPGDAAGYRGADTETEQTAAQWRADRSDTMSFGGGPMPIVPTDPIADGADPGAAMIFQKIDKKWVLITCYPEAASLDDFTRMEGGK